MHSFSLALWADFRVGSFSDSTLSSRLPVISIKLLSLVLPPSPDWWEDGGCSSRHPSKAQTFSGKDERSFLFPWLFLRSKNFLPKDFLQTCLHASLASIASHALLEPILSKRNGSSSRPIQLIPGARDGVMGALRSMAAWRLVEDTEQNGVYVTKEEVGNGPRYKTHSVCSTQCTCKRKLRLRLVKGLPKE